MDRAVTIKLMKEGRLKDQAFVQFADVSAAARTLDRVHGLVVHGKPWVVVRVFSRVRRADGPARD